MTTRTYGIGTLVAVAACLAATTPLASPVFAQDFRVAGGVTIPRVNGRGAQVGGQVQASAEFGIPTSGFGMRLDLLYAQSPGQSLSLADAVTAGQSMRTVAAVGGVFYRREMRDVAPYVVAGGGAYGQTGTSGASLGVHGGIGMDFNGARTHPFFEARMHRLQSDKGALAVQRRERSLVSALIGFRF